MTITAKDISEKVFSEIGGGYNGEEVDLYLDEIAQELDRLQRELHDTQTALAAARAEAKNAREDAQNAKEALEMSLNEAEAAAQSAKEDDAQLPVKTANELTPTVTFNEPSYFKNLETTLRETLISAQRIADETIDEARKRARKIVSEAEEQAATIQEQSALKMAEAKVDYDALRNASEEYRLRFSELVEGQSKLLKESPLFA